MRASPPARPRTRWSAAPTPCTGTKPSWRAAVASREPATKTAPSRESAGWQLFQSRKGRSGWTVRPARYSSSARGSEAASRSAPASSSGSRPYRVAWKKARYGCCVGWTKWRTKRLVRIATPPSTTGNACARAGGRARGRGRRRAAGSAARAGDTASCSGCRSRARPAVRPVSRAAARPRATAPPRARSRAAPRRLWPRSARSAGSAGPAGGRSPAAPASRRGAASGRSARARPGRTGSRAGAR